MSDYLCKSYYDDNNNLQDCTCGKCGDMNNLENMLSKMGDVTIWHDDENYKEAQWVVKGKSLEAGETLEEAVSKLYTFMERRSQLNG